MCRIVQYWRSCLAMSLCSSVSFSVQPMLEEMQHFCCLVCVLWHVMQNVQHPWEAHSSCSSFMMKELVGKTTTLAMWRLFTCSQEGQLSAKSTGPLAALFKHSRHLYGSVLVLPCNLLLFVEVEWIFLRIHENLWQNLFLLFTYRGCKIIYCMYFYSEHVLYRPLSCNIGYRYRTLFQSPS